MFLITVNPFMNSDDSEDWVLLLQKDFFRCILAFTLDYFVLFTSFQTEVKQAPPRLTKHDFRLQILLANSIVVGLCYIPIQ